MIQKNKKILMIFIEPTPYILDLLEKGFFHIKDKLTIVFLTQNLTQNWSLKKYNIDYEIIQSKKQIIRLLRDIFFLRCYQLIHVAGWNKFLTLFLIIASRFFFIPITVESDTPLKENLPKWKKIIKKSLYPLLFKFPAHFLPGGTRQANYFSYYDVKENKITHAQMTVDVKYISNYVSGIPTSKRDELRLKNNAQKNDVVFLFVGRLLGWKGIRELISTMQFIHDIHLKLWIVGDGDLADEIKRDRSQKIIYHGRVSGDDLWDIYNAADVFVLPSYWEPWGLVVNEAMAAGKPVIVSDGVGCSDDLVRHDQEGLLIKPKNIHSLAQAMNYMIQDTDKRNAMAHNAKKRIASWTVQNEAGNIISGWKKSLKGDFFNILS